jgi:hypothetical protein
LTLKVGEAGCGFGHGLLLHGVHSRQAANPRLIKRDWRSRFSLVFLCHNYGFETFFKALFVIFQINVVAHGIFSLIIVL